ncbi:MAG: hypothetical protein KL863_04395 [Rhizobium sp.]|nr:hypothetical protein [Rhizobium sp.]
MNPFGSILDRFLGRGDHAITIPPMDGALRPNDGLEDAALVQKRPGADNLAILGGRIVVGSGSAIFAVGEGSQEPLKTFAADVTCLAGLPDGSCVAGLADGTLVIVGGARDGQVTKLPAGIRCLTALCAVDAQIVVVANGSENHLVERWSRDLLEKGRSGSVWRVDLADGTASKIADQLAFPYGVLVSAGAVVIAEAWASRLVRYPHAGGRGEILLENLPGYPARLADDPDGGAWLSVFAPRSQLVEFVLREDEYRRRMVNEVPGDYWIAPTLRSGGSFLEPLQQGGVKQLGVLKPWSPSRSYGLLVRLDTSFRPRASFHSRADGTRHGVTSSLLHDGNVYFTAKGDGVIGSIPREHAE